MWCTADNHNYMCHSCLKGFLDLNFNQTGMDKMSIFSRNCPKFHIFTQKKKKNVIVEVSLVKDRPMVSTL